jgi:AmmeMemoRadiSam system protein A
MSSLASREKKLLLEVARRALIAAVEHREALDDLPTGENFLKRGGAFVSLHRRARLRGCVGQIGSNRPLVYVVAYCAKAAALEDPRFAPVRPDELAEIEVELSILSHMEEIAPDRIEAGKHGLMVSRGGQRGVLLPQVATQFRWPAARFLEETCVKAGLERDTWKDPGTRIEAFTAEVFAEADFEERTSGETKPAGRTKPDYSSST